jgi:hypothetical protein
MSEVRRFDDRLQIKTTAKGDRFRYRCDRCGHVGRWLTNGNIADDNYETHRFGSIDTGRSRCKSSRR